MHNKEYDAGDEFLDSLSHARYIFNEAYKIIEVANKNSQINYYKFEKISRIKKVIDNHCCPV